VRIKSGTLNLVGLMFLSVILVLLSLNCRDCLGQETPSELAQRVERQIRATEDLPATVKVIISSPHTSEFIGYDALTVTFEADAARKTLEYLVSNNKKTLILITRIDLSKDHKDPAEAMRRITLEGFPVRGNPNAKVVAVIYEDFQCQFCGSVHKTLFPELLKEYGDRVAFVYKDFPVSKIHPWATHAAVDANCLAVESGDAFWDYADFILNNQLVVDSQKDLDSRFGILDHIATTEATRFGLDPAKLESCMMGQDQRAIKESVKEAESLGVSGTPTIFINGYMIEGAQPASEFRAALDRALRDVKLSTPEITPPTRTPVKESASASPDSAAHVNRR
jgi:protein-disulfide isomerase